MLNPDQQAALSRIKVWYRASSDKNYILDGAGGTGKTYLIDTVLKELPDATTLLLAPTHEALKQLKDKVEGDYTYKTVHAALGISPIINEKELKFEQRMVPVKLWEGVTLVIVDECSQLSKDFVDLLANQQVKILYVGHKSQLPDVLPKRGVFDKCISNVFTRGYKVSTLTIPMRNKDKLWDFNNLLESNIYTGSKHIPSEYDISKSNLKEYLNSQTGIDNLVDGSTKLVAWSNTATDKWNQSIREVIYGLHARTNKYLKGDKIILTAPMTIVPNLDYFTDRLIFNFINDKTPICFTNSKAEVLKVKTVVINLNDKLSIPCYELIVLCEGEVLGFYQPLVEEDLEIISTYYMHLAWSKNSPEAKKKGFKDRYTILSCFAQVKHFYAATSYRLQGSTIDNIITINSDIQRVQNPIEQAKHRYVACSRSKNNLMFYRGL